MAEPFELSVNGTVHRLDAEPDSPLLYVLIDQLGLTGPKFGCGLAQCGACSVLLDGKEVRACVTPVSAVRGRKVVTVEGLAGADGTPHPVRTALIEAQAPQCGYCYGGMAIKAAELLAANRSPSEAEIVAAMNGHLCRCGTYPRIVAAIRKAAEAMRS